MEMEPVRTRRVTAAFADYRADSWGIGRRLSTTGVSENGHGCRISRGWGGYWYPYSRSLRDDRPDQGFCRSWSGNRYESRTRMNQ